MYKPGQFVSIGGKLARVSIANVATTNVCKICKRENGGIPCIQKRIPLQSILILRSLYKNRLECFKKLGYDLYPKFIEQ